MSRRRLAATLGVAALVGIAPSSASAVRFGVIGDWGAGTSAQQRVANQMCAFHARAQWAFIATTGDNFYPTGTATPDTFDRPSRCLIRTGLRWRAAWGNHDVPGRSTATRLRSPLRWHTFVSGGAVRFVVLDSNQPENTDQLTFLRRTLTAETRLPVIVVYHHPTRTAGTHGPQKVQQRLWEPLFVKHGVKLVLQGHNHNYERIEHRGVTYVTTGGGGAPLYPCIRPATGLKTCQSTHNFLVIEATPAKIGVRAYNSRGRLIDGVRITL